METEKWKTLSVAGARRLRKSNGANFLVLDGLTRLSDPVAKVLGGGRGYLHLNGLEKISPQAAAYLARGNGELLLNGLSRLTAETARALARYEGCLMLDGVTHVADDVAAELAKFKGTDLTLDGLEKISNKGLIVLATLKIKSLSLGMKSISVEQAKILHAFKGGVGLGVSWLSGKVAAILGRRRGALYLPFLQSLTTDAARGLARHRGYMDLNGLERISRETACQLAAHRGDIGLASVKSLSVKAAAALARVKGVIDLSDMEALTPKVAEELFKSPVRLNLGITRLTDPVAKVISRRKEYVSLYGIKELTDRQVKILLPKFAAGTLGLHHLAQRKIETAWKKAREDGQWPFKSNRKRSANRH